MYEPTLLDKFILSIRREPIGFAYFVASLLIISLLLFDRYNVETVKLEPEPVLEDPNIKRIESLEVETKTLAIVVKQQQAKNEELLTKNTQLEKKQQSQLEFAKRLCEYINVITVHKKIMPRQCLPEYKWNND